MVKSNIMESLMFIPPNQLSNETLEQRFGLGEGYITKQSGIITRKMFMFDMPIERIYACLFKDMLIKTRLDYVDSVVFGKDVCERPFDIDEFRGLVYDWGFKFLPNYTFISNCPGGVSAIRKESKKIEDGLIKTSLILTASKMTDLISAKSVNSSILWGDGAAGILLSRNDGGSGIIYTHEEKSRDLDCLKVIWNEEDKYCKMNGWCVASYVLKNAPKLINKSLNDLELKIKDIDHFIFHQANGNLLKRLAEQMGIPKERVPVNINLFGNTGIASSIITYHQLNESRVLKKGMHYIFVAFGLGEDGVGMQSNIVVARK